MILKLNNTEIPVLCVNGTSRYYQGAQRDTLEIQIAKSTKTLEELDSLFNADNTRHLTLISDDGEYVHNDYSLRTELALKPIEITPATADTPAVTEERVCITLAQKTYQELQLEQLQQTVDVLVLSSLEG